MNRLDKYKCPYCEQLYRLNTSCLAHIRKFHGIHSYTLKTLRINPKNKEDENEK